MALTKKKVVEDLIEYLEGQGVLISQSIIDSKAVADGLVTDANALTDLVAIKAKTDEAILVYDQINSNLPTGVEIISAKNYEYSLEELVDTLIGLGIDQATAQKVKILSKQQMQTEQLKL